MHAYISIPSLHRQHGSVVWCALINPSTATSHSLVYRLSAYSPYLPVKKPATVTSTFSRNSPSK